MPPRRQPTGDPALATPGWRAIRAYWQAQALPDCQAPRCLLPGVPIRYTGNRGIDSLDVGHKGMRDQDTRTTWTVAETRPEHSRCNRSAGARYRQAKHRPTRPKPKPINSQQWL